MARTTPLLSACMIVRNEEANLPRCLASLRGLADELVIVDTGSTDRTVEIAESFGARVLRETWRNDFAFHRNQSLDLATGRWCLVIDADEEVTDTAVQETVWHLERDELPPLMMVRVIMDYPDGKRVAMLAPRLMQADANVRYVHAIHEQLNISDMMAGLSNIRLLHHGYCSPAALTAKERRNLAVAEAMPDGPHAWHCRARSALTLGEWDKVVASCRDLVRSVDASVVLRLEGCVLGGMAACLAERDEDLAYMVEAGRSLGEDTPDLRYLELVHAARRYKACLAEQGDSTDSPTFLRPWSFWHDSRLASAVLEVILGKRKVVERPVASEGETSSLPAGR